MSKIAKLLLIMTIALTMGLFGAVANAQQTLPDPGVWLYVKNVDEFTDEVSHRLWIVAEEIPPLGGKVAMNISCYDNKTRMGITSGTYILDKTYSYEDYWETDFRIDDQAGQTFMTASSHEAFVPYPPSTHIPLIKSMFDGNKLRMRFKTYKGSETVTFKITGIEDEIKPIRQACNW